MLDLLREATIADWLGVFGSITICSAYFAVSTGRLDGEDRLYQYMTSAGSLGLLVSLWFRPNAGAILIEVLWICIAVFALIRIARKGN